ncbi:hypothetical protein [Peterkaempfera sp. SMS 1(5)a]|uniref:hypothetical protein n=1 Tax=Peterkaempfera podocarpi TaxID=3232308 RepID=UPI00366FBB65
MGEVVPYLVVVAGVAAVLGSFTWLKRVIRRRGLAGSAIAGALASYEEAMRITAHDSHHEVRAQAERRAPVLSPGDPEWTGHRAAVQHDATGRPTGAAGGRVRRRLRRRRA